MTHSSPANAELIEALRAVLALFDGDGNMTADFEKLQSATELGFSLLSRAAQPAASPENEDADVLIERLKYFSGWSCRDPGLDMTPTHYLIWDAIDEITRLRSLIRAQSTREPEILVSVLGKLSSTEEMDIDFLLNSLVNPKVDPTFNRGIVAGFRRQLIQVAAAEAALLAFTSPGCKS